MGHHDNKKNNQPTTSTALSAEERAERLIREAEAAKGRVYASMGKDLNNYTLNHSKGRIHLMLVDKEYSAIGSHLDDIMINKIKEGAYIDFVKLLLRDRLSIEEDNRLQPIVKDRQVFWQPLQENPSQGITIYYHWEQAFEVYCNVYTKAYLQRASELIQYSHDIYLASITYVWDNVYQYDKEFRLHLSRYPTRSWTVTLQHAWNLPVLTDALSSLDFDRFWSKAPENMHRRPDNISEEIWPPEKIWDCY